MTNERSAAIAIRRKKRKERRRDEEREDEDEDEDEDDTKPTYCMYLYLSCKSDVKHVRTTACFACLGESVNGDGLNDW